MATLRSVERNSGGREMGSRGSDIYPGLEGYEGLNPRRRVRGGPGVRAKKAEESLRPSYRLNGVRSGQVVSRCLERYTPHEAHAHQIGVLARLTSTFVYVKWDDEDGVEYFTQGDARYEVDRDRWRIGNMRLASPLSPLGVALTGNRGDDRVTESPHLGDDTPPTEEDDLTSNAEAERQAARNGTYQDRES